MKIRKKELRDLVLLIAKPSSLKCLELLDAAQEYSLTQRDVVNQLLVTANQDGSLSSGVIVKDLLGLEIFGIIDNKKSETDKREVTYKVNKEKYQKLLDVLDILNGIVND